VSVPSDKRDVHVTRAREEEAMSRALVCGLFNQKGGCAKTTTTHNLGVLLARTGHRTLLVDFEPQRNLTQSFALEERPKIRVYDALVDRGAVDFEGARVTTPVSGLDLIPGDERLTLLDREQAMRMFAFRSKLQPLLDGYDYVLVDLPPGVSMATMMCLAAADFVLVPTQPEPYCLEGTGALIETLAASREANPGLSLLGFVVTLFDDRLRSHKDGAAQLRESYGERVFKATVRMDARVREAPSHKESVVTYAPRSRAAQDYEAVAREFVTRTASHGNAASSTAARPKKNAARAR
jgi:chromosome partitioning protein